MKYNATQGETELDQHAPVWASHAYDADEPLHEYMGRVLGDDPTAATVVDTLNLLGARIGEYAKWAEDPVSVDDAYSALTAGEPDGEVFGIDESAAKDWFYDAFHRRYGDMQDGQTEATPST